MTQYILVGTPRRCDADLPKLAQHERPCSVIQASKSRMQGVLSHGEHADLVRPHAK